MISKSLLCLKLEITDKNKTSNQKVYYNYYAIHTKIKLCGFYSKCEILYYNKYLIHLKKKIILLKIEMKLLTAL